MVMVLNKGRVPEAFVALEGLPVVDNALEIWECPGRWFERGHAFLVEEEVLMTN